MPVRSRPGRRRDAQDWRETDRNAKAPPAEDGVDPHLDRRLDEALEETFPASDPIALPLRAD